MALLIDVVMTVTYFHAPVSYNNLNNTLLIYTKNQCAYMATQPIHYVSIYKKLLPTQLLRQPKYNKTMSQPRVAIEKAFGNNSNFFAFLGFKGTSKLISVQLERCTLAVHSCKILEVAYIDVQL